MGLTGAGIATLVARILMIVVFIIFIMRESRFKQFFAGFSARRIEKKEIAAMCKSGTPLAMQMGMETASFSLASLLMGWLGATELAAFQVMCITGSLCFLVYYGIGAATSIRISHHRGRSEWNKVKITADAGFHIIMLAAVVLSTIIALFHQQLAMIFTSDKTIQTMFASLLIPMLIYQISDGLQVNYSNALRGIAVTKPLMSYAFVAYICISLPVSYIFGFTLGMDAVGVAMGFPFGLTTAALLYYFRFRKEVNSHLM
jgi:MATE family multidrug resistance protein